MQLGNVGEAFAAGSVISVNTSKTREPRRRKGLEHWHLIFIFLIIYDIVAVNLAYFIGLWLRFDCRFYSIPPMYLDAWKHFALIYTVICIVVFLLLKLYQSMWRFASIDELIRIGHML